MQELHFSWLEAAVLVPFIGGLAISRVRDSEAARTWTVVFTGVAAASASCASIDLWLMHTYQAEDLWDPLRQVTGRQVFVLDELSLPLLPLVSLLYLLTAVATLRTKVRRFSFAWMLISEAIALATFSCKEPWGIISLLVASTFPPLVELIQRKKPTRIYLLHAGAFTTLLITGWVFVEWESSSHVHSPLALLPLLLAILIRNGNVPFHLWTTDLFENATFGTSLLFVTPMLGAYAAMRLVLPTSPDWVLRSIGLIALFTAVYSAGLALVQREARRFFCYLFLSHSSLVLVGLETVSPIGLTGGLCVWLSVGLALGGFGLTLRALEARRGRLPLTTYHGLYEHTPALAVCFLLTGLASVGFPGTFGFVGTEMLVDGATEVYPYVGVAVALAAAMNGIAIVKAYFILFTGTKYHSSVPLQIGMRERFGVMLLAALILGGGLIPQPGVASRHHAATALLRERAKSQNRLPEKKSAALRAIR